VAGCRGRASERETIAYLLDDGRMAGPKKLGLEGDWWIPYQEMLLGMTPSTVDEVVSKFNADSMWDDPRLMVQVVSSVAGSRKNGPELIEFMQKISDTRGYSSILSKVGEIEKLMKAPLVDGGFSDVIARIRKMPIDDPTVARDVAVSEVRDFIRSEAFPGRAVISELIPLMEAVTQAREEGGFPRSQAEKSAVVQESSEKDGGYPSLRKAVCEAVGFEFSAEAIATAAEAVVAAHFGEKPAADASFVPAIEVSFEPVRSGLDMVKKAVDFARGFAEFDSACAGAPWASALDVFSRHWGIFRGTAKPPRVDPIASAIVGLDLRKLKELIGGRDPNKIKIDWKKLPLGVLRWLGRGRV
jgi:hypothetical protein